MSTHELNLDGIVGPTHNYAGLSYGNVASMKHKQSVSNPRQAALQGLAKMKFLADLGVRQAVLPPQERPHIPTLRALGFSGTDSDVLLRAKKEDPTLLAAVSSASAMWAANAATISPSADNADGRVHFTPANLVSMFHRSLETETTARVLKAIFANESRFAHHRPLPRHASFADEGAANHTRLFSNPGPGVQIFAYGRDNAVAPDTKFPARQTLLAGVTIQRLHQLHPGAMFVKQSPRAVEAGAFHNDVVCVGHRDVLLIHESAWEDQRGCLQVLSGMFQRVCSMPLHVIEIREGDLSLADAVATYLFNSQIVTLPDHSLALIAPAECREHAGARRVIDSVIAANNPIAAVHYVDVRQSMHNGGGPACLRLRVMLKDAELAAMHQGVLLTDALYASLKAWIEKNYRERLTADDLADPKLLEESRTALDELTRLLGLPGIYAFQ